MLVPTPVFLCDFISLIDLMLIGDEQGPSFVLAGVQCTVTMLDEHAVLEAANTEFALSIIFPGWYSGEHGTPAQIFIDGLAHRCLQWLPMDLAEKRALISRLPMSHEDRVLCVLAV